MVICENFKVQTFECQTSKFDLSGTGYSMQPTSQFITVGKGQVFPVHNQGPYHEDIWESGGIAPCIHNHGTIWR
jgi:hypothetical protein